MSEFKASVDLKIKEFSDFFANEVRKLDNFYVLMNKKVDLLMGATTRLVEDITAFNNDYSGDLKSKFEEDGKTFEKVDKSLSDFQETLSKVALSSQSSISQEYISAMISSIESRFKTELVPIPNLVLCLPTNVPCPTNVS